MAYIPEKFLYSILLQDPLLPTYQPSIQPDNPSSELVLQRITVNKKTRARLLDLGNCDLIEIP